MEKIKRIYIAGKISGECETPELINMCFNKYRHYIFSLKEDEDTRFLYGLQINYEFLGKLSWLGYMQNDIKVLIECDEIHMLKDWRQSKGARLEYKIAKGLGIKIVFEK